MHSLWSIPREPKTCIYPFTYAGFIIKGFMFVCLPVILWHSKSGLCVHVFFATKLKSAPHINMVDENLTDNVSVKYVLSVKKPGAQFPFAGLVIYAAGSMGHSSAERFQKCLVNIRTAPVGFNKTIRNSIMIFVSDQDGAEPCGNSVAIHNLIRLANYLDRQDLKLKAGRTLTAFAGRIKSVPIALTEMISALLFYHKSPTQVSSTKKFAFVFRLRG